ncbi:MAG: hypothetical protein ABIG43_03020 [Chloroflexota bacterium]
MQINNQPPPPSSAIQHRPFLLRLVSWTFILIILMAWLRFFGAIANNSFIISLGMAPELPIYLMLSGFIWGLIGLPAVWGLWRRRPWTPKAIWVAVIFYALSYWLERIFLWEDTRNWFFILAVTIIWLLIIIWSLKLSSSQRFLHIQSHALSPDESIQSPEEG